jgi:oxygen-independent coproporphyrinogen-3 oxidase
MSRTVGVAVSHAEAVVPGNGAYRLFFDALQEEGWDVAPISTRLTALALADHSALLIGGPRHRLRPEEVTTLRRWVAAGGSLLLLACRNPCLPPARGEKPALLFPGLSARRHSFTFASDRPDISFTYGGACSVHLDNPDVQVTHSVPLGGPHGFAFLRLQVGAGFVLVMGSKTVFDDQSLSGRAERNRQFLSRLLPGWLPSLVADEVRKRLSSPQRHRLLHGYPMRPLMRPLSADRSVNAWRRLPQPDRDLLVGVLPHPFCNPAVKGCGFCTFPHESYRADKGEAVVADVVREIDGFVRSHRGWRGRKVHALYFGGGTANLTPAGAFRSLCEKMSREFDLSGAEITLEGVPAYFLVRKPLLIDLLGEAAPARHYRLSMGLQTFDEGQVRRMGRSAFGSPADFREVVRQGHARGFTVSGDLLFNLPGQTLGQMRDDVRKAIDIGLDHLGLYHLVMFDGLGTEWSGDAGLLARLPGNSEAVEHWLALREMLLGNGFHQTTLTNFERVAFRGSDRRFLYEESAFRPERFDMLGFGPSAFSLIGGRRFASTVKTLNPESSSAYSASVQAGRPWESAFVFGPQDLKILYLTRKIATLGVDRSAYRGQFGTDCVEDFSLEFGELLERGLLEATDAEVRLTPRGMFYADTVAGLLAWRRVRAFRLAHLAGESLRRMGQSDRPDNRLDPANDARPFRMG